MPTTNGISVALCTFNGAAFLNDQLDSLIRQSRPPDEIVICDDGSTDETPVLLRAFVEATAFPVHLHLNPENLGSTKNFEKAISLCNFGIIALSDQDDVWQEKKLACIEEAMKDPDKEGVFSDATVVDEKLRPVDPSLWSRVGFSARDRRRFAQGADLELLLKRNVVTGATFAFRASVRPKVLPIPKVWVHDAWLALVIAVGHRLDFIDRKLVLYRQHAANQIGAVSAWNRAIHAWNLLRLNEFREGITAQRELFQILHERLMELGLEESTEIALVREKIRHLSFRSSLPTGRVARLSVVRDELSAGRYKRFSRGWVDAARDLL